MFIIVGAFFIIVLIICFVVGAIFLFGTMVVGSAGAVNGIAKEAAEKKAQDDLYLRDYGRTGEQYLSERAQILEVSVGKFPRLDRIHVRNSNKEQLRARGASETQVLRAQP